MRTLLSLAACTLVHLGVGASVLLYVFVHACGEMIPVIGPVAPLRDEGTGSLHSVSAGFWMHYCT